MLHEQRLKKSIFLKVIDWLSGEGEEYFRKHTNLGNSLSSAGSYLKKHEEFDVQSKEIVGSFAAARTKAKELLRSQHPKSSEIQEEKAIMDRYCRNFAFRMEQRQFLLISSVSFHHWAQVVSSLRRCYFFFAK